ncbi:DNA repair and recombination protein RAD54B [Dirofilaria immitis]|nr:DNA repair and recombination protein RAD54B [Dirofilaria immitis]
MRRHFSHCENTHCMSQSNVTDDIDDTMTSQDEGMYYCYEVLYGKISSRMHKRWQGDGLLFCRKRSVILQTEPMEDEKELFSDLRHSLSGEEVGRASGYSIKQLNELKKGSRLKVNSYEVEVQAEGTLRQPAVDVDENTEKQQVTAELMGNIAITNENVKKRKGVTYQNFISPFFGRDDPLDFGKNEDGSIRRVAVDVRIARCLKPHQKDGIAFIYRCLKDSDGGAILADEMGLGKLFRVMKSADVEKLISCREMTMIAIFSYELIARTVSQLSVIPIDLLVCDEAHRLKNLNGRLREQLQNLHAERRLLLTGTPMQNDLEEFYSLINFARPDLFGAFSEFKHTCEVEPTRFNELLAEVMLRRTAEVIHEWLPPKNDYIVWCRPSPLQCSIYKRLKKFLSYDHLTLIDVLRKLCNHPSILYHSIATKLQTCKMEEKEFYNALLQLFPNTYSDSYLLMTDSGKLNVFGELLGTFREQEEKIVVVSNFTKTLDLLEELCQTLYYTVLRLDGSTEAKRRMEIVEEFNLESNRNCAFLLSAKAGGLGLNLIGASRMILFDSDWNPAVDMQAMARIWRQGQKNRAIFIGLSLGMSVRRMWPLPAELEIEREMNPNSPKLDVENVPSERTNENDDSTSVLEDSVQSSSADSLVQNCNDNEVIEDQVKNKILGDEAALSASALMGTLMRWQHYSPKYEEQFELMKAQAGLEKCCLEGVSFIMKLVSNF